MPRSTYVSGLPVQGRSIAVLATLAYNNGMAEYFGLVSECGIKSWVNTCMGDGVNAKLLRLVVVNVLPTVLCSLRFSASVSATLQSMAHITKSLFFKIHFALSRIRTIRY